MEGNQMKMREALELFVEYSELVCKMGMFNRDRLIAITTKARAAIAKPPRNCDVGTPDEQGVRCLATMRHWRKAYQGDALITAIMKWAHAPYEEERKGE